MGGGEDEENNHMSDMMSHTAVNTELRCVCEHVRVRVQQVVCSL